VNVDEFLLAAYNGAAERSFGIVPPGMVGHRDYNLMKYDPKAAKALLDEAGVKDLQLTLNVINKADDMDLMEQSGAYIFTTHGPNAYLLSNRVVPSPDPDRRYEYRLKFFRLA
jgi:ABC-type transport system substrate-binding protein